MTTPGCSKSGRKHTPIMSGKEQGAMGIAYSAKKGETPVSKLRGPAKEMYKSMPKVELKRHLVESKGKSLPEMAKKSTKGSPPFTEVELSQGYRKL